MIYAPIIIPTCNRVKHLKRCIESLSKNSWAQYTDLFISVDYPPSKKYEAGNQKVIELLQNGINGFKNIHVFIQEQNIGPAKNAEFLINATQKYDRWIFTEDDNEFSCNFLEYINLCLQMFENDDSILTVCGFLQGKEILSKKENIYRAKYFQPYGYATWRTKWEKFDSEKNIILLDKKNRSFSSQISLYKANPWCFRVYVNDILYQHRNVFWKNSKELNPTDGVIQLYLCLSDKYSIFPTKAKSRTWGNDGSGFTMKENKSINPEKKWILDKAYHFTPVFAQNDIAEKWSYEIINDYRQEVKWENLKLWLKYLYCKIKRRNGVRQ